MKSEIETIAERFASIINLLKANNVDELVVDYSGVGDSGSTTASYVRRDGDTLDLGEAIPDLADRKMMRIFIGNVEWLLEHQFGDWEDNDGAHGSVVLSKDGTVSIDHQDDSVIVEHTDYTAKLEAISGAFEAARTGDDGSKARVLTLDETDSRLLREFFDFGKVSSLDHIAINQDWDGGTHVNSYPQLPGEVLLAKLFQEGQTDLIDLAVQLTDNIWPSEELPHRLNLDIKEGLLTISVAYETSPEPEAYSWNLTPFLGDAPSHLEAAHPDDPEM